MKSNALSRGLVALLFVVMACGGDDAATHDPDASIDAGNDSGCVGTDCCAIDDECDDGVYCNGVERCVASHCSAGTIVICDDSIACTTDACWEDWDSCEFTAPDADNDGHTDASCLDANDEPLGDDCDDHDVTRFPGNPELCAPLDPNAIVDEDCNPLTFGDVDTDGDGSIDSRCCNTDGNDMRCGLDCDDTTAAPCT